MGPKQVLAVWRTRWLTVALVALLTLGAVATITLLTPKKYVAESQVFVSARQGSSSSDLVSGNTFAQSQVQSYMDVVTAPVVLQPVIEELDLKTTPADLKGRITVAVPDGTVLMNIQVADSDPTRAADTANELVSQFQTRVGDLETLSTNSSSPVKISVLQAAVPQATPVAPSPARNLAIGAALGLLVGLALALAREVLDTSVGGREDVSMVTDAPVIGTIPFDAEAKKAPLVSQVVGYSARAEAFRALRTNLQFVQTGGAVHSFVLTSSLPAEGKTTTTANLALTLTALGARVCIIEGDLRRPRLLHYLDMEGAAGLTNVLIGEATLDDVLQEVGDGRLAVLGAGPIPPNPSELLGSPQMESLVRQLEQRFDFVIIDAPPLLPVTDAAVLSRIVGGVVLCIGVDVVHRDELRRSIESLNAVEANLLGLIINRSPAERGGGRRHYYHDYESAVPNTTESRSARRVRSSR